MAQAARTILDEGLQHLGRASALVADMDEELRQQFDTFVRALAVAARVGRWVAQACVEDGLYTRPIVMDGTAAAIDTMAGKLQKFRATFLDDSTDLGFSRDENSRNLGSFECSTVDDLRSLVPRCACGLTLRPLDDPDFIALRTSSSYLYRL